MKQLHRKHGTRCQSAVKPTSGITGHLQIQAPVMRLGFYGGRQDGGGRLKAQTRCRSSQ